MPEALKTFKIPLKQADNSKKSDDGKSIETPTDAVDNSTANPMDSYVSPLAAVCPPQNRSEISFESRNPVIQKNTTISDAPKPAKRKSLFSE